MKLQHILILFISILFVCSPAQANERYALVIGNAAYPNAPLINPVNDVSDMAAKLQKRGFQVTKLLNAKQQQMEVLEVHWLPLEEALKKATSGEITDSKTIVGLFRAFQHPPLILQ